MDPTWPVPPDRSDSGLDQPGASGDAVAELHARLTRVQSDLASVEARLDGLERRPPPQGEGAPGGPGKSRSTERNCLRTIDPPGFVWDGLIVVALLVIAASLRVIQIATVPFGFHGDEAAMGIEAGRILKRGWIGVYSGESGGTPAGPYYAVAASVHFFSNTIFAVRLPAAIFDSLTVVCLFILVRRNFGRTAALLAEALAAISAWQLAFARIAFINSSWPFTVVIATIALAEAMRTRHWLWWGACGALMAAGLYSYPGHLLFLGVVGLYLLFYFTGWQAALTLLGGGAAVMMRGRLGVGFGFLGLAALGFSPRMRRRATFEQAGAFAVGFVVASWPMIQFARTHRETYFRTGRDVSIFSDPLWTTTHGVGNRASLLVGRYVDFWIRLIHRPVPDGIDGTGAAPLVPLALAMIAGLGMIWLIWRRRDQPLVFFAALVVLVMPIAVSTSNGYPLRRALVLAPFIAMFAAVALAEFVAFARTQQFAVRVAAFGLVVVALGQIAFQNIDGYFGRTAPSDAMYWTLAGDLVHSVNFMTDLPLGDYVYFYAERWPFDSGERQFLAPGVEGESRSAKYGVESYLVDPAKGRPVLILIGKYQNATQGLKVIYPDGSIRIGPGDRSDPSRPSFIAFYPNLP